MSQRALLLAVRDRLKTVMNLGILECEVMPDGQPPAASGDLFIAVHEGEWRNEPIEGMKELYGVEITVTRRAAKIAKDRLGPSLMVGPTGESMDETMRQVINIVNMNDAINDAANAIINVAGPANGFVETLRFSGADKTREVGPEWFDAAGKPSKVPVGLARTLHFGECRRYQTYESES